ncbi:hypothetical protein [Terriglobus tenax]|uniref:hypothetical protein n=1 Tax=Terriglobus tenax TaxID=1111115 RepID=UPI0021E0C7F6|nr:hypothetical protein [Terriglobus tenax]
MRASVLAGLLLATATAIGQSGQCTVSSFEGEVEAGQTYRHPINSSLELVMDPLPSGWLLRVLPSGKLRPAHDYAELATPPYQSVTPLAVSTDFSFRAQDAVAWNPRSFRFATTPESFQRLLAVYNAYMGAPDAASRRAVESKLTVLIPQSAAGELTILDAKMIAGTANQAGLAAMVASHLAETAHTVVQPNGEKVSSLGKITWFRFRISLWLPSTTKGNAVPCR